VHQALTFRAATFALHQYGARLPRGPNYGRPALCTEHCALCTVHRAPPNAKLRQKQTQLTSTLGPPPLFARPFLPLFPASNCLPLHFHFHSTLSLPPKQANNRPDWPRTRRHLLIGALDWRHSLASANYPKLPKWPPAINHQPPAIRHQAGRKLGKRRFISGARGRLSLSLCSPSAWAACVAPRQRPAWSCLVQFRHFAHSMANGWKLQTGRRLCQLSGHCASCEECKLQGKLSEGELST